MSFAYQLQTRGFAITQPLFSAEELDAVAQQLSTAPRSRAGARHLMKNPLVARLANATRLLRIAQEVLGDTATPFRATLFDKNADSNCSSSGIKTRRCLWNIELSAQVGDRGQ